MLSLPLSLLLILTACSKVPAIEEGETYDTASGSIRLEAGRGEKMDLPAEFPPADGKSPLGEVQSLSSGKVPAEVRGVWFSYLEFQGMLTGRNEKQFAANIADAFDKVKNAKFNTVFVQVRPYADALYPSGFFPWSHIATGEEGKDPGFDPLGVMVREARGRGLRIEAWINPYRVRTDDKDPLSPDSPAYRWLAEGDEAVVSFGGGIYFNPASEKARGLIVDGVREIVENYDVDGIHFDDYFYPTTSEDFDRAAFESYRAGGGKMALAAWRRENVNILVREVYAAIKEINPQVLFGISPQGNNDNNLNAQFIDTAKWLSTPGYLDYICPQVYFGFENERLPFKTTVEDWNRLIKLDTIKLYIGMAPYKLGAEDQWAGAGAEEWLNTSDLLARMVQTAREQSHYGGFVMFRYDFLFNPQPALAGQVDRELQSLEAIL